MRYLPLAVLICLTSPAWLVGSENAPRFHPLDLPSGGVGVADHEEDLPEMIVFFGREFEGDGFFFLLDRSGSMYGEKMGQLKAELQQTITSLNPRAHFGLVAFSNNVMHFCTTPSLATPANKALARTWVDNLQPLGATHLLDGATAVLAVAAQCEATRRTVIVVGDGLPNAPGPQETLDGIQIANYEDLPFNTILFGSFDQAIDFMSNLATLTGGQFSNQP